MGLSNYPPGVTGNELEVNGPEKEWEAPADRPECPHCRRVLDVRVLWQSHRKHGAWWFCPFCEEAVDETSNEQKGR